MTSTLIDGATASLSLSGALSFQPRHPDGSLEWTVWYWAAYCDGLTNDTVWSHTAEEAVERARVQSRGVDPVLCAVPIGWTPEQVDRAKAWAEAEIASAQRIARKFAAKVA